MIGGKVHGQQRPTALGSLVNAMTYGMAIPTIHGTTQSNCLGIWAQHLRQGKCRGKKYKGKKKGTPNYIENIDFLIGSNPIEGVLQAYLNNGKYSLNFIRLQISSGAYPASYTFVDPYFYFLLAVTGEITNQVTFNDYGSPNFNGLSVGVSNVVIAAGGSGYVVGDHFGILGTNGAQAIGVVSSVSSGSVTGFTLLSPGSGYSLGTNIPTSAITGTGTGLQMHIQRLGPTYIDDTSEYPLWNVFQHGPDIANAAAQKFFPFVYYWAPGTSLIEFGGENTFFPGGGTDFGLPGGNGNLWAYYAQLSSQAEHIPPITAACLTFENELGNGPEYGATFASQQIVYPEYAGAGSPDIDLGSSGAIPQIAVEVKGSNARWHPRGDADFADMIEDTIKSGMIQAGSQLGLIQRGVNCNELPGAVDKFFFSALQPTNPTMRMNQPVAKGQVIFVAIEWNGNTGAHTTDPTISDISGQTWTPLITGNDDVGYWYAIASANIPAGNKISVVWHGAGFPNDATFFAWVMDPSSNALDGTPQSLQTSGSGTASLSIATSGPAFLVAFAAGNYVSGGTVPSHWNNMFPNGAFGVMYRYVKSAGTYTFSTPIAGASGAFNLVLLAIKNSQSLADYPEALGNILDSATLDIVRAQCQANGLMGSVTMNSQSPAADWLKQFYQCANAAPVWAGFKLLSIAWSEVSYVGNGRAYTSPTATGPVATITESDMIGSDGGPLWTVTRKAQVDSNNIAQIQSFDRNSDYAPTTASEPFSAAIALFGPRKESPINLPMLQDPNVARRILNVIVNSYNQIRNTYKGTVRAGFMALLPMDVASINESKLGISNLPVRITKVTENDDFTLEIEAEQFVYGAHAPNQIIQATASSPYAVGDGGDPGSVNTPIIFEAVPRLGQQNNQGELWLVVSGSSVNYGGCAVLVSTDGGSSYNSPTPNASIQGNAITGVTTADWPAANDPDTTHDLSVDLTESNGTLETYAAADRDNFTYVCYVAGGTATTPYELMCYDIATLTSTSKYTLPATGGGTNELRRGVFGAPGPTVGIGVDHPNGSRFAFLGNPNSPVGVFKLPIDPSWIGKTLHFKFLSFNTLGNKLQDESAATAYAFTPTGTPGQTQNPNNQNYTVTGGALTQPTTTDVHMAQATGNFPSNSVNYNARDFTIPVPTIPTTYYVTIYDPSQVGDTSSGTTLSAYCDSNTTRWNTPNYVRIGSIVALPSGGGTTTGGGGSGAPPTPATLDNMVIGFPIASGNVGTNVGAMIPAPRTGQLSTCKIVTKSSDPSMALQIKVKMNGTDIFSTDPTVAAGTASGTVSTFTALTTSPLPVAQDAVFSLDVVTGGPNWSFTVQLE